MVFFEDLAVGDMFQCVDSGDLVFKKTDTNAFKSYADNSLCVTTRVNCYIPRQAVVIKLEGRNENETN